MFLRLFQTLLAFAIGLMFYLPARADVISVKSVEIAQVDDGFVLNADFEFDLTSRLEQALNSGVSLTFVVEFELEIGRAHV